MWKAVRRFVPIVLAISLLMYTLRGLPLDSLLEAGHQAAPGWIGLAGSLVVMQLVLRGLRWRMLLRSLGHRPSLGHTMTAMLAGNAASMLIPGSGELTRCTVMARTDGVPMAQSVGSVVAERMLDMSALLVLLVLSLPFGAGRLLQFIRNSAMGLAAAPERSGWPVGWYLALSLVGVGAGVWIWQRYGRALATRLHLRERFNDLKRGLLSVRNVRSIGWFISVNLLIHLISLASLWIWLLALPTTAHLPTSVVPVLFAVISLGGLTIPTQANVGTFHFLASRVLILYGLQQTDAVVWATFVHALSTLFNVSLSGIGFLLAARVLKQPMGKSIAEPQTLVNEP